MEALWFSRFYERHHMPLAHLSRGEFLSLLRPKCKQIITDVELAEILSKNKKLTVKLGIDTTGSEIHLGHAVPLMILRLFQRRGDQIHFIIGDFTGQIGDPSGRTQKRVQLSAAEIKKNMKTYERQIGPLINLKKAKIHKNSTWLKKMTLADYMSVAGAINFSLVAQREDFRERAKTGAGVTLREANYASLMAIDSLHLKADIEVGGIDQLLNMMQAREVMEAHNCAPEVIITTPLIEGTAGDGRKMSKSFENYIALGASPGEQFGLIMSIPDSLLISYFTSFADVYDHELGELEAFIRAEPLEAKKQLGMLIVAIMHSEKKARSAREEFERKFSKREYTAADEDVVSLALPAPLGDALSVAFKGVKSRSALRILVEQGGVKKIEGGESSGAYTSLADTVAEGDCIKVGKMHIFRFKNS